MAESAAWAEEAYQRLQRAQRYVTPEEQAEREREQHRVTRNASIKRRLPRVV